MSEDPKLVLDWIAKPHETSGNTQLKFLFFENIIFKVISTEKSEYYEDINGKNILFYDTRECTKVRSYINTDVFKYKNLHFFIVFNEFSNENFIISLCNNSTSPYNGYRAYVYCNINTAKQNKIDMTAICDFDGHIDSSEIVYSGDKRIKSTYYNWDYDDRNLILENLIDNLLIILTVHRDNKKCVIQCHDVKTNKRWQFFLENHKIIFRSDIKYEIDSQNCKILKLKNGECVLDIQQNIHKKAF